MNLKDLALGTSMLLALPLFGCGQYATSVALHNQSTQGGSWTPINTSDPKPQSPIATSPSTPPPEEPRSASTGPACGSDYARCGFNYSGGYGGFKNSLVCRLTYYLPSKTLDWKIGGQVIYFSNCGTCRDVLLYRDNAASIEGPIFQAGGISCEGSALLDRQIYSMHNFEVETLSDSSCSQDPTYFSFPTNQCQQSR